VILIEFDTCPESCSPTTTHPASTIHTVIPYAERQRLRQEPARRALQTHHRGELGGRPEQDRFPDRPPRSLATTPSVVFVLQPSRQPSPSPARKTVPGSGRIARLGGARPRQPAGAGRARRRRRGRLRATHRHGRAGSSSRSEASGTVGACAQAAAELGLPLAIVPGARRTCSLTPSGYRRPR